MKTLQENIDATLASQTAHVVTGLVEKGIVEARALFLHEDGYRILDAKTPGFKTLVHAYITREKPAAYALITDAIYASDQRQDQPCVLSACVLQSGLAKNDCLLYKRDAAGVELGDATPLFLEEDFHKYYDNPLDFKQYNEEILTKALDTIVEIDKQAYMEFFLFQA
jgi:hypothetical protein